LRRLRVIAVAAIAAVALAIGLVPALAPAVAVAARPNLTMVSEATYAALPDEHRVAVSVALTATNHLRNTVTRRFYFRTALLTVQPGASAFRISGGSGTPKVAVVAKTATYTNIRIDFGANLAAGRSTTLALTFDLRDAGGAPDRPLRVSPSLITFAAWAFATPETPGSTVAVRLPTGYTATIGRGPLTGPEPDGEGFERWSSGSLEAPLEFIADIAAVRPSDYLETTHTVTLDEGEATVLLRSWADDTAWRDRIASLVDRALPVLERSIGLAWPIEGRLSIDEALVQGPGGYSGLFDPAAGRIEVAYAAADIVVLHDLAHAWFNGRLVVDRWAAEAFASYYADLAATELGLDAELPLPAIIDPASPQAIPLNAWEVGGGEGGVASEAWAYAASAELGSAVAARAGEAGLQHVWAAASTEIGAYDGPAAGPPDWRGLLDLLEDTTGQDYADLWAEWVARPGDLALLADRAAAREHYAETMSRAGEWQLPPSIRDPMRAWRFEDAEQVLAEADSVLAQRDAIESDAAEAGVTLPGALQAAFEGDDGPGAAADLVTAERGSFDAILAARNARPADPQGLEQLLVHVGLLGQQPDLQLAAAELALASGQLELAWVAARTAETAWSSAASVGRSRIVSTALLVIALIVFVALLRRSRRRGSTTAG
jgi:hypothetical protein